MLASGTPPTGSNLYWCANNFAVMVWRDQMPGDGSAVTLTTASMAAAGSSSPSYPDNGAGTACFNKPVFGGYFCLYGNMYWINPAGPSVAYFGQPVASGADAGGNAITNSWNRSTAPTPESASIDQTASNFTFFMPALDPAGGGPLVIQGVVYSHRRACAAYGSAKPFRHRSDCQCAGHRHDALFGDLERQFAISVVHDLDQSDSAIFITTEHRQPDGVV